jgi:FG-GAP repeat
MGLVKSGGVVAHDGAGGWRLSLGGVASVARIGMWSVAAAVAIVAAGIGVELTVSGGVDRPGVVHHRVAALGGLASVPAAAQPVVSAALGSDDAAYRVLELRAANPAQRLGLAFSTSGVTIRAGLARVHLSFTGFGYASAARPVAHVKPDVVGNRVSYLHPGVREWYANGPLGLEQAFNVLRRPSAGAGPLTLSIALSGDLSARLEHDRLMLSGHGASLRYSGLTVTDARGRTLRSWLELRPGRVLIRVDDHGARYPLRVDPFVQQAELSASDGGGGDRLGASVAISGQTIAVGAPFHAVGGHGFQGAVYVFTEPGGGWANATQTAELTASNGAASDEFGTSVAISGQTIVAGAPYHGVAGEGAVYVLTEPGGGWASGNQTAELTASDSASGDHLGAAVAVDGSTVVAGAPGDKVGVNGSQGAVYEFTEPGGGWANGSQTAKLTASDGAVSDQLGESVGISGMAIAAGAPSHMVGGHGAQGAVYVFTEPGGGWASATQNAELTASDGASDDELGASVAINGQTIVAGAPAHAVGSPYWGAAYVFTEPGGGWANGTQTAELTASDGASNDHLGTAVAFDGSTVVAGAPGHTVGGNGSQGAVYVFPEPGGGWANATQAAQLIASDGNAGHELGDSVAVSGQTIAAGAIFSSVSNGGNGPGKAYVFGAAAVGSTSLWLGAPSVVKPGSEIAASSIAGALSGGSAPTGTITFKVFGPRSTAPTSCASGGTTVGTATASNNGTYHPTAGFTPPGTGDYWWYASYAGDLSNNAAHTPCGKSMAKTLVSLASPSLSTAAPSWARAGSAITASLIEGTLSGGSTPTGTITFKVFGPQSTAPGTCTSGGRTVGTATVSNDGTYHSTASFTPASAGDYWWYASYGGDSNNNPARSRCGGSMPKTVVEAQGAAIPQLYWSTGAGISKANADGTGVRENFIKGGSPTSLAIAGSYLYWINRGNATIGRATLGGASVNQAFITGANAAGLAISGSHIYWSDTNAGAAGKGTIVEANLNGSVVNQKFIKGLTNPGELAVYGSRIYWLTPSGIGVANLSGTGADQSFIGTGASTTGLSVAGQHIYWTIPGNRGTVGRANLDGTGVNGAFIKGLSNPAGVAVSNTSIYWTGGSGIGTANLDGSDADSSFIPSAVGGQQIVVLLPPTHH